MCILLHQWTFEYIDVFPNTSVYFWIHWCVSKYISVFLNALICFQIHQCIFEYIDVFLNTSVYFGHLISKIWDLRWNNFFLQLNCPSLLIINLPPTLDKFNNLKTYWFIYQVFKFIFSFRFWGKNQI